MYSATDSLTFCLIRRPALTIHSPPTVPRPQTSRDTATRITLPSNPAIGGQKSQPQHTMTQVSASCGMATEIRNSHKHSDLNNHIICAPQKPIFSTVTPVAAATVAPIVATNTVSSTTTIGILSNCFKALFWEAGVMQILIIMFSSCLGTVSHTQMNSSTIVTMTMASHSSHATAVTTSTIPVGKVAPFSLTEVLIKSVACF